ncbi:RNA-directed DNA polymerase, eukaryota [Tanacetum coccineum]|uniref:RNA-directed DNA polymerase, eukaryota n=1 Tax=Tanacetum coccineum TaxID=301880 RepID=A0ABQ5J4V6_9ASTR
MAGRQKNSQNTQFKPDEKEELFTIKIQVKHEVIEAIVDTGSQKNSISATLVQKLGLPTTQHPSPYSLGWISNNMDTQVKEQCKFRFAITSQYVDEVICEVVPLDIFTTPIATFGEGRNLETIQGSPSKSEVLSASHSSSWSSIIKEINTLKAQGVDLISHCKIRVGNGRRTSFWNDLWIGDASLRFMFPRLYALDTKPRTYMRLVCRWWNVLWIPVNSYQEWIAWFKSLRMSSSSKGVLKGVFYTP